MTPIFRPGHNGPRNAVNVNTSREEREREREREREKEGEDWTEGREGVVVTTSRGGKGTYTNVLSGLVIYECKLHERVDLKIFEITNPVGRNNYSYSALYPYPCQEKFLHINMTVIRCGATESHNSLG